MTNFRLTSTYTSYSPIIVHEGKQLNATQDPFIYEEDGMRPHCEVVSVDKDGNKYKITWDIFEGYDATDEDDSICMWERPTSITLVK